MADKQDLKNKFLTNKFYGVSDTYDPRLIEPSKESKENPVIRILKEIHKDPGLSPVPLVMPITVKTGVSALAKRAIELLRKTRLAGTAEDIPAFRYQRATGEFTAHPGRGSTFVTIAENPDKLPRSYPIYDKSLVSEGGEMLIEDLISSKNPLFVPASSSEDQLALKAIKALRGEYEVNRLTDFSNYNAPLTAERLSKLGFNRHEIKSILSHPGAKLTPYQLLIDNYAAKLAKSLGFDAIMPLTPKAPSVASEAMLLK